MEETNNIEETNKVKHSLIYNPVLFLICTTAALAVCGLIFLNIFLRVEPDLTADLMQNWLRFFILIMSAAGIALAYGLVRLAWKKPVQVPVAFILIAAYMTAGSIFISSGMIGIFTGVPEWIAPLSELFIYLLTFIMPGLLYAISLLVVYFSRKFKIHFGFDFLIAAGIAFVMYLLLFRGWLSGMFIVLFLVAISTVIYLFFFFQGLYRVLTSKMLFIRKHFIYWKLIFTLIFPLLGLALNQGIISPVSYLPENLLGNFSHPLFLGFTLLTGISLTLPHFGKTWLKIVLFFVQLACLPFAVYFLIVFIPFVPVSMIATIILGLGFLLLSPCLLFFILVDSLRLLYLDIKPFLHKAVFTVAAPLLAIALPVYLLVVTLADKANFDKAMHYAVYGNYDESAPALNRSQLQKTITLLTPDNSNPFSRIPYLQPVYCSLVYPLAPYSRDKLAYLDHLFFKYTETGPAGDSVSSTNNPGLESAVASTVYNAESRLYESWIDLTILNKDEHSWNREFRSTFHLPEGSWVTDYYLYLGSEKVTGQLTERRAGLWLYDQITRERKDPGLLYYQDLQTLILKVFPCTPGEPRKTGFKVLHLDPITLTISGRILALDSGERRTHTELLMDNSRAFVYVPAAFKQTLPVVVRPPVFHFLADCSADTNEDRAEYIIRIKNFLLKTPAGAAGFRISCVNSSYKTLAQDENWQAELAAYPARDGLGLDRALKGLLTWYADNQEAVYPVLIVLKPADDTGLHGLSCGDFRDLVPEIKLFYELRADNTLDAYALDSFTPLPGSASLFPLQQTTTRSWIYRQKQYWLADNGEPEILIVDRKKLPAPGALENTDQAARLLAFGFFSEFYALYPAARAELWWPLYSSSMRERVLTGLTAFTVLETETQRRELERLQNKIARLSRQENQSAKSADSAQAMSAPPALVCLVTGLAAVLVICLRRKYKKRSK